MSDNKLPPEWQECKIEDIARIQVGRDLKESAYSKHKTNTHVYPVYSNTVEDYGLYGYYDFEEYPGNSITVVGRGVGLGTAFPRNKGFGAIGRLLVISPKNNSFEARYLAEYINTKMIIFNESSGIPQLPGASFAKYKVILPTFEEQVFIADTLEKWDRAIEVTENLITAKQKQFEWLTTRLINQSGGKKTLLSDFVTEVSTRNRGGQIERVLSVTNRNGFVLPEDQFERRVASADVSNYKVVERGQYAYNPSRINVGSIARLDDWDNGILSPMYTVFKLDNKKIDSDYFLHWLSSTEAKQRIRNSAQGSVRETVSFGDLGSIPMALPSIPEQKSIAHTLNTAQGEIKLLQALAEKYRTQKRGLMQKLLSGQWRLNDKKEAA